MILIHPYWQSCPTNLTGATSEIPGVESGSDARIPYYGLFDFGWSAWILTAAELGGAKQISGIGIFNTSYSGLPYSWFNQTVKAAHITESQFPNASQPLNLSGLTISDLKTVRSSHNFNVTQNNVWTKHTFDSNFCYNGTSNLLLIWEHRGNENNIENGFARHINATNQGLYVNTDGAFPTGPATRLNTKPRTLIYY